MSDEPTHDHDDETSDAPEVIETAYAFVVYCDEEGAHIGTSAFVNDLLIDRPLPTGETERVLLVPQRPAGPDDLHRGCSEVIKDVEVTQIAQRVVQTNLMLAQQMAARQQREKDIAVGQKLITPRG